jgi:hypothetical protein
VLKDAFVKNSKVGWTAANTDHFYERGLFFREIKMNHNIAFVPLPTVTTVENFFR